MVAAGQFLMVDLFNECGSHIMSQMDEENCIGIWRFGLFYKAETLAKNARHFILANFRSIFTKSEEFDNLEATELAELIGDDRLNVDDERIVWDSIVKWIQCSKRDRISTLTDLVNNIRLGICSDDTRPRYTSDERLKTKILQAIEHTQGFGIA
ncbi:KLHL3 (predicted) [Pycnogonum litorale]